METVVQKVAVRWTGLEEVGLTCNMVMEIDLYAIPQLLIKGQVGQGAPRGP